MDIKSPSSHQDSSNTNIFLTGAVILANFDYSGMWEYAVKAAIGGVVWMGFKLAADYLSSKINRRR